MNPKSGGPSQGIRNYYPSLLKAGIIQDIICLDDENEDYDVTDPFKIIKMGKGFTSFQFSSKLDSWLEKNASHYDFIIVHGIWQYHNYAVYKALKKNKIKKLSIPQVVIIPHGMLDPYFQNAPDRKLKALRNKFIWFLTEKKAINAANAIFFTCEEELRLAKSTFKNYKPKKEINIGYGIHKPPVFHIDMKAGFEKKCPEIINKPYWLFLSRIDIKKGIDLLIIAYNELKSEGHILPELVIAGPNQSMYAQKMIKLGQENTQIHFPGMLNGNAKWGAFYLCDTYVLASHQENFGISIVEAMACKKPVLITKSVNIWKEITDGSAGWAMSSPSSDSIKKHLLKILNLSSDELKQTGKNAFELFEDKFIAGKNAENFISFLNKLKN